MQRQLSVLVSSVLLVAALAVPVPTAAATPAADPVGDWPQLRHDPGHTGTNPDETIVSATNVAGFGLAWTVDMGEIGSSPTIADGVVYMGGGPEGDLVAYAVGCGTGGASCTPLWTADMAGGVGTSAAVADGVVYIVDSASLYAFATDCAAGGATCTPLWTGSVGVWSSSPVVADGMVYVNGGAAGVLYAFEAGCGSGGASCTPLWTARTEAGGTEPAVSDGVVYVGVGDTLQAYAARCATGGGSCVPLWTGAAGGHVTGMPAVAGGIVAVGSTDGLLYAFAVGCGSGGSSCAPSWTGATGGAIRSSPAIADGVVYVGSDDGRLYAFAADCGSGGAACPALGIGLPMGPARSPVVANGVVYVAARVGTYGGRLVALEAACVTSGAKCPLLWTGAEGREIPGSAAVAGGVLYVASDARIYAYDLEHGDVTPPVITVTPRVSSAVPSRLGAGSTLVSWMGSDGAGSGVAGYELQQQKDGGAWTTVASTPAWTTSASRALAFGHAYRFRVRAHDLGRNTGTWSTGSTVVPKLIQGSSSQVRYPAGTWRTQRTAAASGGTTRWSTSAVARAKLTFTGRSVAWVTSTGPTRGRVRVYLDGVYRTTVDLRAADTAWRQVLFSASWGSRATHTISLRSTLAGGRVDIDAFVVYR